MRPAHFIEATIIEDLPVPIHGIGHNSRRDDDVLNWPAEAIRAMADEQERRILAECALAEARQRLRAANSVMADQIFSRMT